MTEMKVRVDEMSTPASAQRSRWSRETSGERTVERAAVRSVTTAQFAQQLRAARVVSDEDRFPEPPSDLERDLYLGPQWRWVGPVSFLGYLLILVSVSFFIHRHPFAWFLIPGLLVGAIASTVSLITSSRKRRDCLASHRQTVTGWLERSSTTGLPSVDVFLPSAGEDLDLLANTYHRVAALRWGGELVVHVLDDSGRVEVENLAARNGFRYHCRPDRGHFKKAGNLRYGFEHSDGDVILVLDADFVPRPDALNNLVPYLDDASVGIVQSPQFFDVTTTMNWLQRAAGATQVLFYRWVQPSRDRSNAAICVGTSAIYRRSALQKAGGFALIGHSEDVHTGVRLLSVGYQVRYVPVIVTKGLCPDSLDQFITQQYRWCTGSMSLLLSKSFHAEPLTLMQRLCYWSGFLYYITTAVNVFLMSLPSILMAWFAAADVTTSNYVFVLLALVTRQVVVTTITFRSESLLGLARVQTTYSFCHALAIYDTLRGRTDAWVATGTKTKSPTSERVSGLIRWWCGSVQVLLWVAIIIFVPLHGLDRWWLLIAFTLLNLYVVAPLILHSTEPFTIADRWRQVRAVKLTWDEVARTLPTEPRHSRASAMVLALASHVPGRAALQTQTAQQALR